MRWVNPLVGLCWVGLRQGGGKFDPRQTQQFVPSKTFPIRRGIAAKGVGNLGETLPRCLTRNCGFQSLEPIERISQMEVAAAVKCCKIAQGILCCRVFIFRSFAKSSFLDLPTTRWPQSIR